LSSWARPVGEARRPAGALPRRARPPGRGTHATGTHGTTILASDVVPHTPPGRSHLTGDEHRTTDPAAPGPDPADALLPIEESDDLHGYETGMARLVRRSGRWLAAVLAAALLLPGAAWLVDELAFRRSGGAVESALGEDAALVESVLLVRSVDCTGQVSTGSAFVVAVDGAVRVVTNRHVVDGGRTVSLRPLAGGAAQRVESHALSSSADVAVLTPREGTELPPALELGEDPRAGEEVRLIGFPSALPFTTAGTIAHSAPDRTVVDLQVDPGASGSPIVDSEDRVVAQVFGRTGDGHGVATPASRLRAAVADARPAPPC
jgi:hypothetical protein